MNFRFFFAVVLICTAVSAVDAQTRLRRPCPATTTPATVDLGRDGDITLRPCSGRSILINGSPLTGIFNSLNGVTATAQTFATPTAADTAAWSSLTATHTLQLPITAVSGTLRVNSFPYFNAANTLARSGFTWDGAAYKWDNNNGVPNTTFPMVFNPQITGNDGAFSVGSNSSARIQAQQSNSTITLTAPNLVFSATNFTSNPSITPAGTTGNQTINQAIGTVNFAAAATAITVTDSVVTANSLIFTVTRTNDATCSVKNVTPAAGSFTIRMTAACTAETSVGFWVIN